MLLHTFADDAFYVMLVCLAIILLTSAKPATTGSATILVLLCPTLTRYFKPVSIFDAVTRFVDNHIAAA